jgi:hypothetical protein
VIPATEAHFFFEKDKKGSLCSNREMAPAPSFFPIKNGHITLEIPLEAPKKEGGSKNVC